MSYLELNKNIYLTPSAKGQVEITVPELNKIFSLSSVILTVLLNQKPLFLESDLKKALRAIENIDEDEIQDIFNRLLTNTIIVNKSKEYNTWRENNWLHALYFHLSTKNQNYLDKNKTRDEEDAIRNQTFSNFASIDVPHFFDEEKSALSYKLLISNDRNNISVGEVLLERRTSRKFDSSHYVELHDLSKILINALGDLKIIREKAQSKVGNEPRYWSFSKFVATEVYVVIFRCTQLQPGVYWYNPKNQTLELIRRGFFEKKVGEIAIGQGVNGAAFTIFLTANLNKYMWRYRHSRALRNLFIEAGLLAQRLILSAQMNGYKNFLTPALRDSDAQKFLKLSRDQIPTYLISIGK